MSELKPCPFCGGKAVTSTFFDWDDLEYMPIEVNDCDAEVTCENERCINGWYLPPEAWNTRPIEDALNARIAELEALVNVSEDLYGRIYEQAARIAELEAEVTKCHELQDSYCDRIAELSQAVGLITTLKPTMVMDTNHPLDMVREVAEHVNARIAELERDFDMLFRSSANKQPRKNTQTLTFEYGMESEE